MRQIFLDCDGVLADMDAYYTTLFGEVIDRTTKDKEQDRRFWRNITKYCTSGGRFYYELPLMPDALELVEGVKKFCSKPIILTGGDDKKLTHITGDKLAWRDKYFPDLEMIVCKSREKCLYGKPGDILVDDWEKYKSLWEDMGGIFYTHYDAADTLMGLDVLYRWDAKDHDTP